MGVNSSFKRMMEQFLRPRDKPLRSPLVKVIILADKLMVNSTKPSNRIHPLSILAAVVVAGLLFLLGYVLILMVNGKNASNLPPNPAQALTIIPAYTETPVVIVPTSMASATPDAPVLLPSGVIGIGAYVKVGRTEGAGLRIRADASTSAEIRFIAYDDEVFKVIGGPIQANNYTWWQMEALYDKNRSGWSVDSFLDVVDLLTPTP
jgi:hypothetical protein